MKKLYALIVPLCLVLGACTTADEPGADQPSVPIGFSQQAETRAVVSGNSLSDGDKFKVWGGYNGNNVFEGREVTYTAASGCTYQGTEYWVPGQTYNFYAIYPAELPAETVVKEGTITVTGFDCSKTGDAAVDLMTAIRTGVAADGMIGSSSSVELHFQHALARVTCKVAVVNSEVTVNSLRLYGVGYQGNYSSASTPSWSVTKTCTAADGTPFATASDVSFTLTPTNTSRENVLGDLLLLPQDLQNGAARFVLAYRHNGLAADAPDRTVTVPLPAITWEAGSSYNYTLTIQAEVTLNVSVKDWDKESTSVSWGDGDTTTGSGS